MKIIKWWDDLTDERLEELVYPLKTGALVIMILFFMYLIFEQIRNLI